MFLLLLAIRRRSNVVCTLRRGVERMMRHITLDTACQHARYRRGIIVTDGLT